MAYARPSFINFASADVAKTSEDQAINFLMNRIGLTEAAAKAQLNAADWKNARPSNYFGESNMQAGDILLFPTKAELANNRVANAFSVRDEDGKEVGRVSYGVRVATTIEGKKRDFFMSSLFSSAIDNNNKQAEVRTEMPDALRNALLAGATQEAQYDILCDFMEGKALKVAEKIAVSTPTQRNGQSVKRNIYKFEVLEK